MEDIFDKLNGVLGITKYSGSEVITPKWVATDMVDLLPAEVFNKDSRFLDPAVKSGRFLAEIYRRLMDSDAMKQAFPDRQARQQHILDNQLYGFATSAVAATIARKQLYDDPADLGNIRFTGDKVTKELIQGAFGIMKFDVVIGNPPYNNDIYLDFVTLGHNLASKYTCMITPAKWQAKDNKKNADFRKNLVPYMRDVVFYPDCLDVFGIAEPSGISYYLIDRNLHDKCNITNISVLSPMINSKETRSILSGETLWNYGNSIVNKIKSANDFKPYHIKEVTEPKTYTININKQLLNCLSRVWDWDASKIKDEYIGKGGYLFDKDGKAKVFCNPKVITASRDNSSGTSINLFTTDSVDEAKSYVSWVYSKFVGFLIIINKYAQNIMSDNGWRFVPDPGAFDHIFTDKELYKKYNLTQEEIAIIESVIKERK